MKWITLFVCIKNLEQRDGSRLQMNELQSQFDATIYYKTLYRSINISKLGVIDSACVDGIKAGLARVRKILEVDVHRKLLPEFFSHKACDPVRFTRSTVIEQLA